MPTGGRCPLNWRRLSCSFVASHPSERCRAAQDTSSTHVDGPPLRTCVRHGTRFARLALSRARLAGTRLGEWAPQSARSSEVATAGLLSAIPIPKMLQRRQATWAPSRVGSKNALTRTAEAATMQTSITPLSRGRSARMDERLLRSIRRNQEVHRRSQSAKPKIPKRASTSKWELWGLRSSRAGFWAVLGLIPAS